MNSASPSPRPRPQLLKLTLAIVAVAGFCLVLHSLTRRTYEDAVGTFGVAPSDLESDLISIESVVLGSLPIGTELPVARDTLEAWGLSKSEPASVGSRSTYSHWVPDGNYGWESSEFLIVREPFTDPLDKAFSYLFFCEKPSIAVSLGFKDGELLEVEATSNLRMRACI